MSFIRVAKITKIKTLKPIILSEKISRKKPAIKALYIPKLLSDFSYRFQIMTRIKIKLGIIPQKEK